MEALLIKTNELLQSLIAVMSKIAANPSGLSAKDIVLAVISILSPMVTGVILALFGSRLKRNEESFGLRLSKENAALLQEIAHQDNRAIENLRAENEKRIDELRQAFEASKTIVDVKKEYGLESYRIALAKLQEVHSRVTKMFWTSMDVGPSTSAKELAEVITWLNEVKRFIYDNIVYIDSWVSSYAVRIWSDVLTLVQLNRHSSDWDIHYHETQKSLSDLYFSYCKMVQEKYQFSTGGDVVASLEIILKANRSVETKNGTQSKPTE
jgi:hypothetical protein